MNKKEVDRVIAQDERWQELASLIGCQVHGFNNDRVASFIDPDGKIIPIGSHMRDVLEHLEHLTKVSNQLKQMVDNPPRWEMMPPEDVKEAEERRDTVLALADKPFAPTSETRQPEADQWVVPMYESERGWGSKIDGHAGPFNGLAEANDFVTRYNAKFNNKPTVPDYYIKAMSPVKYTGQTCDYKSVVDEMG
jgi:hypothetical protein